MSHPDKTASQPTEGILVIDKPIGRSSMSIVAEVRRKAGGVKTGHAGTLDPLATGVLVLALGRATKAIDQLMATDKRYATTIDLSAFTATDDAEGERTDVAVASPPDREQIESVIAGLTGHIMQRPPAFSAIKIGGRRAYKLARKGQAVHLPERPVTIHQIEVVSYEWPLLAISVHCEKGVYIRSLARSIGEGLGTGGHCVSLRRTAVGPFDEAAAIAPAELREGITNDDLIPLVEALERVRAVVTRRAS